MLFAGDQTAKVDLQEVFGATCRRQRTFTQSKEAERLEFTTHGSFVGQFGVECGVT